jgi:cell division protein FtsL
MSKILIINKQRIKKIQCSSKIRTACFLRPKVLSMKESRIGTIGAENKGSIKIGLASFCFLMVVFAISFGAYYLFQVNTLAMKGYEIKDLENKISELEKENKKMQIKEMELKSMYSIERSAEGFNLVNPRNVSYLEAGTDVKLK